MITTQNATPQHPLPNLQQNHASTVAKTVDNIYMVQEHERAAQLEIQVSQRQAGCVKGVEKFDRVYMRRLLIDLVHTVVGGLETWKDVKDGAVEIINRVIP